LKSNYDYHINRKYKCSSKVNINNIPLNISPELLSNTPNYSQITPNYSQITPKLLPNTTNKPNKIKPNLCCKYCDIIFTRKQNLDRHLLNSCKIKLEQDNNNLLLKEENIMLKEEISKLKEKMEIIEQSIQPFDQAQMCKVSKSKNTNSQNTTTNTNSHNATTTNTNTNSHNSVTNNINNNSNNNVTVHATLNFGEEKLSNISEKEILKALTQSITNAFLNFIQVVNLNENNPEHQNILINNMQNDIGTMVEDNKLIVKSKQEIIENIFDTRLPAIYI